jgi:hypothetical protein
MKDEGRGLGTTADMDGDSCVALVNGTRVVQILPLLLRADSPPYLSSD